MGVGELSRAIAICVGTRIPFFATLPSRDLAFDFRDILVLHHRQSNDQIVCATLSLLDASRGGESQLDTVDLDLFSLRPNLDRKQCCALLQKYLDPLRGQSQSTATVTFADRRCCIRSYTQLHHVLSVLATQLVAFHGSEYFTTASVKALGEPFSRLRSSAVLSLIRFCLNFCAPTVDIQRLRPPSRQASGEITISSVANAAPSMDLIPWSELDPMLVFHRSNRSTLSFLTTSQSGRCIPEYDDMFVCWRFLRSQLKELRNYESMETAGTCSRDIEWEVSSSFAVPYIVSVYTSA